MVERHSGAKSKFVLITKSSKEQYGYEGALDRDLGWGPKTAARRPRRTQQGARRTALAAKNHLDHRSVNSRSEAKNLTPTGMGWETMPLSSGLGLCRRPALWTPLAANCWLEHAEQGGRQ